MSRERERTRLATHLSRVHDVSHVPSYPQSLGVIPRANVTPKTPGRDLHPSVDEQDHSNHEVNSKGEHVTERRLDASRDCFWFREEGRFGSHSVPDDFGDDSIPKVLHCPDAHPS